MVVVTCMFSISASRHSVGMFNEMPSHYGDLLASAIGSSRLRGGGCLTSSGKEDSEKDEPSRIETADESQRRDEIAISRELQDALKQEQILQGRRKFMPTREDLKQQIEQLNLKRHIKIIQNRRKAGRLDNAEALKLLQSTPRERFFKDNPTFEDKMREVLELYNSIQEPHRRTGPPPSSQGMPSTRDSDAATPLDPSHSDLPYCGLDLEGPPLEHEDVDEPGNMDPLPTAEDLFARIGLYNISNPTLEDLDRCAAAASAASAAAAAAATAPPAPPEFPAPAATAVAAEVDPSSSISGDVLEAVAEVEEESAVWEAVKEGVLPRLPRPRPPSPAAAPAAAPTQPPVTPPACGTAWEEWDVVKGLGPDGCAMVAMRHRRHGTEAEVFIGSFGRMRVRPGPLHYSPVQVDPDGAFLQRFPGRVIFEAPNLMRFLRLHPGCGWLQGDGGFDDAMLAWEQRLPCPPPDPSILRPVPRGLLEAGPGWIPDQDRWGDWDRFDYEYIHPGLRPGDPPVVCRPIGAQQGYWSARIRGDRVIWRNSQHPCELYLTPEGLVYLGGEWPFSAGKPPRAAWVEYALGGSDVEDGSTLLLMPLREARRRLGLAAPATVMGMGESAAVDRLVAWARIYGWHDLQERLLDRNMTDSQVFEALHSEYARYWRELLMQADDETLEQDMPLAENHTYALSEEKRFRLEDFDEGGFPHTAVDPDTGETVWRKGQPPVLVYPWARQALLVERRPLAGPGPPPPPVGGGGERWLGGWTFAKGRRWRTRVLDRTRSPPELVAEYDEILDDFDPMHTD